MHTEIERVNGEIRLWFGRGERMVWRAQAGRKPHGPCFLQHYRDGQWWSHILPHWRQFHPAPEWPL